MRGDEGLIRKHAGRQDPNSHMVKLEAFLELGRPAYLFS